MVPVVDAAETQAAAEWAADYVAARDGTLVLIGAWPGLVHYGLPPFTVTYDPEPAARAAVEAAAGAVALDPAQVRAELVRGDTGRLLAARSREVDLLVVGRRAGPPLLGALLGSLADYCVRQAACPVVVVPLEKRVRVRQRQAKPAATESRHMAARSTVTPVGSAVASTSTMSTARTAG
jgi:nucleotide-binding universal stress UspA family protein